MEICYDKSQFERFVLEAFIVSAGQPVLIDQFLEDAIEVDVDCVSDGEPSSSSESWSISKKLAFTRGDSACSIPPYSLVQKRLTKFEPQLSRWPTPERHRFDECPVRGQKRRRPDQRLRP